MENVSIQGCRALCALAILHRVVSSWSLAAQVRVVTNWLHGAKCSTSDTLEALLSPSSASLVHCADELDDAAATIQAALVGASIRHRQPIPLQTAPDEETQEGGDETENTSLIGEVRRLRLSHASCLEQLSLVKQENDRWKPGVQHRP